MRRVCPMCGARDAVIVKDPDGDWCSCGNCGGVNDLDTTRGTFAESHALDGEIVSVEPLRPLVAPEDIPAMSFYQGRPRRTADDAALREAFARLCDACDALCEALGDLPEPAHHRYRTKYLLALGSFQHSVRDTKAALLLPEKMPR